MSQRVRPPRAVALFSAPRVDARALSPRADSARAPQAVALKAPLQPDVHGTHEFATDFCSRTLFHSGTALSYVSAAEAAMSEQLATPTV